MGVAPTVLKVIGDVLGDILKVFLIRMDHEDLDIIAVFLFEQREFSLKFFHTGTAIDIPEVDDRDFALGIAGLDGAVLSVQRQIEIGTKIADLSTHLCRRRIFVDDVVVYETSAKDHGHGDGNDGPCDLRFLGQGRAGEVAGVHGHIFGFHCGAGLVGSQQDLGALIADRSGGTDVDTASAADTFMVAYMMDIHLALAHAQSAVYALGLVQLHPKEGDLVEQPVNRAKGAEEPAEGPVDEYRCDDEYHKDHELPREQGAQHTEKVRIRLVGQQSASAQQGAGGADVLTKSRKREIPEGIQERQDDHHGYQQ